MKRQDNAWLKRFAHEAIALPAGLRFISEGLVWELMGNCSKHTSMQQNNFFSLVSPEGCVIKGMTTLTGACAR